MLSEAVVFRTLCYAILQGPRKDGFVWGGCCQHHTSALLQACLPSKAYLSSTAHLWFTLVGSLEFISPDSLAVIIVSHLQWNITLFLELFHILGSWLRWSYVPFCFFLSSFYKQDRSLFLLKFAVSSCYWCAASFVLTAKKILDCCPVCLQRLIQSLQSKVSGFFSKSSLPETRHLHTYEDLTLYCKTFKDCQPGPGLSAVHRYTWNHLEREEVPQPGQRSSEWLNFILF